MEKYRESLSVIICQNCRGDGFIEIRCRINIDKGRRLRRSDTGKSDKEQYPDTKYHQNQGNDRQFVHMRVLTSGRYKKIGHFP